MITVCYLVQAIQRACLITGVHPTSPHTQKSTCFIQPLFFSSTCMNSFIENTRLMKPHWSQFAFNLCDPFPWCRCRSFFRFSFYVVFNSKRYGKWTDIDILGLKWCIRFDRISFCYCVHSSPHIYQGERKKEYNDNSNCRDFYRLEERDTGYFQGQQI